jgi:hypothetical protein
MSFSPSRCLSRWPWGPLEGPREPHHKWTCADGCEGRGVLLVTSRPSALLRSSGSFVLSSSTITLPMLLPGQRSVIRISSEGQWGSGLDRVAASRRNPGERQPAARSARLLDRTVWSVVLNRTRCMSGPGTKRSRPCYPIALQHLRSRSGVPF